MAIRNAFSSSVKKQVSTVVSRSFAFHEGRTIFGLETDSNNYSVNWSLKQDDVTPVGDAYRNIKKDTLLQTLKVKADEKAVEKEVVLQKLKKVAEAGQGVSHEDFESLLSEATNELSNGQTLYIEDASVSTSTSSALRTGVRVITQSAPVALTFRNLLVCIIYDIFFNYIYLISLSIFLQVPVPDRPLESLSRFDGWNLIHKVPYKAFNPETNQFVFETNEEFKGTHPITVFHAGDHDRVAFSFVGNNGKMIGVNIVAGKKASIADITSAIGTASAHYLNSSSTTGETVTLPGTTVLKGNKSVLILGDDEDVVKEALKNNATIYSPLYTTVSAESKTVSSLFDGFITSAAHASKIHQKSVPVVTSSGLAAASHIPDNTVSAPTQVVVLGKQSKADVEQKLKEFVGENEQKKQALEKFIGGVTFSFINKPEEIKSVIEKI